MGSTPTCTHPTLTHPPHPYSPASVFSPHLKKLSRHTHTPSVVRKMRHKWTGVQRTASSWWNPASSSVALAFSLFDISLICCREACGETDGV